MTLTLHFYLNVPTKITQLLHFWLSSFTTLDNIMKWNIEYQINGTTFKSKASNLMINLIKNLPHIYNDEFVFFQHF